MSMKRKKKATEAEAVGFSMDVPGRARLENLSFIPQESQCGYLHTLEGEENGNHHHAYEETEGSPHHGLATAIFVGEERWIEGA